MSLNAAIEGIVPLSSTGVLSAGIISKDRVC